MKEFSMLSNQIRKKIMFSKDFDELKQYVLEMFKDIDATIYDVANNIESYGGCNALDEAYSKKIREVEERYNSRINSMGQEMDSMRYSMSEVKSDFEKYKKECYRPKW